MTETVSLRRSATWSLAGTAAYIASQWALLIVLAKLGTPRMVGQVALGIAIAAPIFFFSNLGLRQVLATDARHEYSLPIYVRVRAITVLLATLVVALAGLLLSSDPQTRWVIVLIGVAKSFEALSDLAYGLFQKLDRMDSVGQSMILRGGTSVAAVVCGLHFFGRVEAAVALWALIWALVLLLFDLPAARRLAGRSEMQAGVHDAWHLARAALPLGIAGLLITFYLNVPRYWIAHFYDEALLGLFAAASYIPMGGRRVLEALGQAAVPRLSRQWANGNYHGFGRLMLRLLAIGCGCGAAGILFVALWGERLLVYVYAPEYASQAKVFLWLMVSWSLRYPSAFLASGLIAVRRFRLVPQVYVPSVIAALVGGALLVPRYGTMGAAWADMISAALQLLLTAALALRLWSGRDKA